tara:strand:- start:967 stop:1287 length:321 start_codon:yes stop_codon:yes gene_type:complete
MSVRGTTWSQSNIKWSLARYTFAEFSLAYELDQIRGSSSRRRRKYAELWKKSPEKKERFIELFLKVNGVDVKHTAKISPDVDVDVSDIDLVIQEILQKPTVSISVA